MSIAFALFKQILLLQWQSFSDFIEILDHNLMDMFTHKSRASLEIIWMNRGQYANSYIRSKTDILCMFAQNLVCAVYYHWNHRDITIYSQAESAVTKVLYLTVFGSCTFWKQKYRRAWFSQSLQVFIISLMLLRSPLFIFTY